MEHMKRYMAESLGTAILVFVGCGAAVIAGDMIGYLGIALAFGLTVVALAYSLGHISGCHLNPAISVGFGVSGQMKWGEVFKYIIAQCIGAILGAGILYFIMSGKVGAVTSLAQNGFGEASPSGFDMFSSFVMEVVVTFIFVRVVLGATSSKGYGSMAGLAIGLTLTALLLVAIPVTGASLNPARSLGPAFWLGGLAFSQLWLFWVAPLFGAILAGSAYSLTEHK